MKRLFLLLVSLILFFFAQSGSYNLPDTYESELSFEEVHGVVLDSASRAPLSGASVMLRDNRNIGTTTNQSGEFSIDVPADGVLVVSFLGYQSIEISLNGRRSIEIYLSKEATGLDEVVVIGYGTQKKRDLTGAVSSISDNVIQQSPSGNITNSLAGRLPGVIANNRSGEPGVNGSEIFVRGKGTLNDNSALIVIDGVPDRGDFGKLNPSDIESITVLKDASAAIYGARAANGVILVTTKRGKIGAPTVTYTGDFGLTRPTRMQTLIDAAEYATWQNEVNARDGIPPEYSQDAIEHYRKGDDLQNYPNTDWYKEILSKVSPQTRHSLSIRGGNDKVTYFFSGGYFFEDGIFKNSATYSHQYNIRSNIDAKINKNLDIALDISGRVDNNHYSNFSRTNSDFYTVLGEALGVFPTLPAFYPNGFPGPGKELGMNPVLMATGKTGYYNQKHSYLQNSATVNLKLPWITNGLKLVGLAAFDFQFNNDKMFKDNWDAYNYDPATNEYTNLVNNEGPRELRQDSRNFNHRLYNIRLEYDRTFGAHHLSGFVAYEQSENYEEGIMAYRTGYGTNIIQQLSAGPDLGKDNAGDAFHQARQNVFSRIGYDYKSKYIAEFIVRRDGSFIFPPGNRWGTFPAVSVGWRISEEPFFKQNIQFVNELKIKGSWGRMGNDRVNPYQFLEMYSPDMGYYLGAADANVSGLSLNSLANPNITWETADSKNIGIESSLFNNRLSLELDYFFSNRSDILIPRESSIPGTAGLTGLLPDENIGIVKNHGVELNVDYNSNINKDFSYQLGFNFTFARNRVVFMDEAPDIPDYQKIQGHSMDSWLVFLNDGIYHNQDEIDKSPHIEGTQPGDLKYRDVDEDGEITSMDMVRIHMGATPEIIYGTNMGFRYKNISLDLFWQGQGRARQKIQPQQDDPTTPPRWMFDDRWTPDHPENNFPAAFDRNNDINNRDADFWLQNSSFLRLKTVRLGYSFPAKMLSGMKINDLQVYFSGYNLATFSKMKYYDPEINIERGAYYPQVQIFNFGLNLTF